VDEEVEDAGTASGSGSEEVPAGKKSRQTTNGFQDKAAVTAIYANCLNLFETKVSVVIFYFFISSNPNDNHYFI
jgi:hypothetical protein